MITYDVLILGAGPAGLSAGLYAARAGAKTAIVENLAPGGQINLTPDIANVPGHMIIGGAELAEKMGEQALNVGCEIIYDEPQKVDFKKNTVKCAETEIQYKSLIIATGQKPRNITAPRAEDFIGNGIHFCGLCDGAFYKGRNIVIVGGGNHAVEEAIYLSSLAKSITMVTDTEKLTAQQVLIDQLSKDIKIHYKSGIAEIFGENKVAGVRLLNSRQEIHCDGIFVCIGRVPNTDLFKKDLTLDRGYIVVDKDMRTNLPNVFAAGDVTAKSVRQVITACADGAVAATFATRN